MYDQMDHEDGIGGYCSNQVYADTSGNIAYQLIASVPIRKDKTPYIGQRILDGTTSEFDWETGKTTRIVDLPRSLNPSKGFIVNSNNRQAPDYAKYDYGATQTTTARAVRLTEILKEKLSSNETIKFSEFAEIQEDLTDVYARQLTPQLVEIASSMIGHFTS